MHTLNIGTWSRKEQFLFFRDYDNPFFNICTQVDVSNFRNLCQKNQISFFLATLFASIKAANLTEEFRYRIKNESVIVYDSINAGSTILNADNTFSFCYFTYASDFNDFYANAQCALQDIKTKPGLNPQDSRNDLIHYSVLPWFSFTSFSHAKKFSKNDSIPKIVFGKYQEIGSIYKMPLSIEVNHALVDGVHVANYLKNMQEILNSPLNLIHL